MPESRHVEAGGHRLNATGTARGAASPDVDDSLRTTMRQRIGRTVGDPTDADTAVLRLHRLRMTGPRALTSTPTTQHFLVVHRSPCDPVSADLTASIVPGHSAQAVLELLRDARSALRQCDHSANGYAATPAERPPRIRPSVATAEVESTVVVYG